ncbi:proline-rich receptor-like protein kinase PERK5 [Eurytemora carolleeae]|uniref:proline-rich receptor-like protein kinase PERK5 n=1 Tax=Eurytemora carolleeae TaxID=1294199 RepID=UPI000C75B627|nr:proline-rich receptor-like protein kinase PERK5 [Eurytemora carolleeae]|eukprot:XP_023348954.1 proline-rich receptor-like protein kinase PERK5 [Eurytemora affinis]
MDPGPGEDPMHLYQVFQSSFNKIAVNQGTAAPKGYDGWGQQTHQHQQHLQQEQQYSDLEYNKGYIQGYDGYYLQDGYYQNQISQPSPHPSSVSSQYTMLQSPIEEVSNPVWSPPPSSLSCTPSSLSCPPCPPSTLPCPPSTLPCPPTSVPCPPLTCASSYERVKPDPDSVFTGLDDALNILKSHAEPFTDPGIVDPAYTAAGPPPPLLPPPNMKRKIMEEFFPMSPYDSEPSSPLPRVSSSSTQRGGKRRKNANSSDDDGSIDPETKGHRDKDRRYSNNARERMRIRDINDALNELGRVCMMLKSNKGDKPQTKLGVLNMAVDVINTLESQVRERNLNPTTVCMNRPPGLNPPTGP